MILKVTLVGMILILCVVIAVKTYMNQVDGFTDPCESVSNDTSAMNVSNACLQKQWKVSGCSADGTAYPPNNYDGYWKWNPGNTIAPQVCDSTHVGRTQCGAGTFGNVVNDMKNWFLSTDDAHVKGCKGADCRSISTAAIESDKLIDHDVKCNSDEVVTQLRLMTTPASGSTAASNKYQYTCCKVSGNSTSSLNDEASTAWKVSDSLENHDVKCTNSQAIYRIRGESAVFNTNGDVVTGTPAATDTRKYRYKYTCANLPVPSTQVCTSFLTTSQTNGDLSTHNTMICGSNQGLSKVKRIKNSDNTYQYSYTCCNTKVPAAVPAAPTVPAAPAAPTVPAAPAGSAASAGSSTSSAASPQRNDVQSQVALSDTSYTAMFLKQKSDLLNDIQKLFRNEILSNRSTDSSLLDASCSSTETDSTAQGNEYRCPKNKDGTCPPVPDMTKYIKKDSIPCWGCSVDY